MITLHCPNINQDLVIQDYELTPIHIKFLAICHTDIEFVYQLQRLLDDMDCSVFLKCGKLVSVNTPKYEDYLSLYMYYASKIQDQMLYNKYIDKLIERHEANVKHDELYFKVNPDAPVDKEHKVKGKRKLPLWVREESIDLFENTKHYIYTNTKNGEIIHSKDPDLIAKGLGKKNRDEKLKGATLDKDKMKSFKSSKKIITANIVIKPIFKLKAK